MPTPYVEPQKSASELVGRARFTHHRNLDATGPTQSPCRTSGLPRTGAAVRPPNRTDAIFTVSIQRRQARLHVRLRLMLGAQCLADGRRGRLDDPRCRSSHSPASFLQSLKPQSSITVWWYVNSAPHRHLLGEPGAGHIGAGSPSRHSLMWLNSCCPLQAVRVPVASRSTRPLIADRSLSMSYRLFLWTASASEVIASAAGPPRFPPTSA